VPTLSQPCAQGQVENQQAAVNPQAVYQTKHLQFGSHQSPFQTNQPASFHLGQPHVNQVHQHGDIMGEEQKKLVSQIEKPKMEGADIYRGCVRQPNSLEILVVL